MRLFFWVLMVTKCIESNKNMKCVQSDEFAASFIVYVMSLYCFSGNLISYLVVMKII